MVGPDAGVNYGGILNRDTQVMIIFHCIPLRIRYSTKIYVRHSTSFNSKKNIVGYCASIVRIYPIFSY